jgi:hypothetical protein
MSLPKAAYELVAGDDFGQQNLPGMFGIDYQFVSESAIDFFLEAGVNTFVYRSCW